ncbi:hypothetical protein ABZ419_03010 [Streptomyces cinnamoneus]|uniref:hypothetical protein n=1 Tax=Streptomyces cinnamoneus TaxID=53446 RepID=UPI0033C14396
MNRASEAAERRAFQGALDDRALVDTGTLRHLRDTLLRDTAPPPSAPLIPGPPPNLPCAPVLPAARSGRRRHARPRHRHRGDRARRSPRLPLTLLIAVPAVCVVIALVPLLR